MALIPHNFFPRNVFDIDMFDPFDAMDSQFNSMVHFFDRPLMASPIVPQKYRVTVNCEGYSPKFIKTEILDDKLIVSGSERENSFQRTFNLPEFVETSLMTSFMDKRGTLVIDIPYKMSGLPMDELMPKMVDLADGRKAARLSMALPTHVDPSHVHVTAKDHDLIVKAQEKTETDTSVSKVSFYRRCTMPENADLKHMRCVAEGNRLVISAPLADHALPDAHKRIPIEAH